MIKLKYVGESDSGKDFIPGIPADDLEVGTEAEAKGLVASGLYVRVKEPRLPDGQAKSKTESADLAR